MIRENNCDYCLVETLDYRNGKGMIAAYASMTRRWKTWGLCLEEPFPSLLSLPVSLQWQDLPLPGIQCQAGDQIYEAVRFPSEMEAGPDRMKQVSAVDSLIFEQGGKWWLLTNIDTAAAGDHSQ